MPHCTFFGAYAAELFHSSMQITLPVATISLVSLCYSFFCAMELPHYIPVSHTANSNFYFTYLSR